MASFERTWCMMSRMLGTICTEAPVDTRIETYDLSPANTEEAARLLAKLECFSLIDKLGLRAAVQSAAATVDSTALWSVAVCENTEALLLQLRAEKRVCFLMDADSAGLRALRIAQGTTVWKLSAEDPVFWEFVSALTREETVAKITHEIKPVYAALENRGLTLSGKVFDTALAAYLLNPSASGYELKKLAQQENLLPALPENAAEADWCAAALPAVSEKLALEIVRNDQQELLEKIELPLARVLAEMELAGFAVDGEGVSQYGEVLSLQIDLLQKQIYESVGYEFNINSPKQLGEALFEKLSLPYGKKTKTGYSTNAEILENLRDEHPAVAEILEYRTLSKLKSTYCDGLTKVIAADGRIHSSFNQTETRTGRISSTEPNLQNIPTRTDVGRELRRFFRAQKGWTLIDADYSQIELRVLAHGGVDHLAVIDRGHRRTVAQMAGNHFKLGKRTSHQLRAAGADEPVRRSVKAIAAHVIFFIIFIRNRVKIGIIRHRGMECGVEHGNLRHLIAENGAAGAQSLRISGIVQRRKVGKRFNLLNHLVVHQNGLAEHRAALHNAVTHGANFGKILDNAVFGIEQRIFDLLKCHHMVLHRDFLFQNAAIRGFVGKAAVDADALAKALCHHLFAVHIDELIFHRRTACVNNQNLHAAKGRQKPSGRKIVNILHQIQKSAVRKSKVAQHSNGKCQKDDVEQSIEFKLFRLLQTLSDLSVVFCVELGCAHRLISLSV